MNPVLPSWFSNSAPSRVGHSKKFLTWAPLGGTIGHPKPSRDKNENTKVRKSQWSNKFQLVSTSFNCNCEELWSNSLTDYEATFNRQDSVNSQSQHVTTCDNMSQQSQKWAHEPWLSDEIVQNISKLTNLEAFRKPILRIRLRQDSWSCHSKHAARKLKEWWRRIKASCGCKISKRSLIHSFGGSEPSHLTGGAQKNQLSRIWHDVDLM
jgi:hypothetical protein